MSAKDSLGRDSPQDNPGRSAGDTVRRLAAAVASDPDIAERLLSVLWIGSRSHGLDVHTGSDLDIQVVLDQPDARSLTALSGVLAEFPGIDLSILYPKDVWDCWGDLDFQDGTKGAFFLPVLADGVVLHGSDFYASLRTGLPADAVRSSLRFTIREYLGRLRVMALDDSHPGPPFNKYVMKLLKDLLVHAGLLSSTAMVESSNADLISLARGVLAPEFWSLLGRVADYASPLDLSDRTRLLVALERLFDTIERQQKPVPDHDK